jgi:hypothetical protein
MMLCAAMIEANVGARFPQFGWLSRQSVEQFYQARLIGFTHRGLAIQLDPFGMLDPQIVVNLFSELGYNRTPEWRMKICASCSRVALKFKQPQVTFL